MEADKLYLKLCNLSEGDFDGIFKDGQFLREDQQSTVDKECLPKIKLAGMFWCCI